MFVSTSLIGSIGLDRPFNISNAGGKYSERERECSLNRNYPRSSSLTLVHTKFSGAFMHKIVRMRGITKYAHGRK